MTAMLPAFLIPETTVQENGEGPATAVTAQAGVIQLTLGITRITEQESIDVTIWGSADKTEWGKNPMAGFPQKFYCGTYSIMVDLSTHPEVNWIQVRWHVNRWGRGSLKPLFSFYVFAQTAKPSPLVAGARNS